MKKKQKSFLHQVLHDLYQVFDTFPVENPIWTCDHHGESDVLPDTITIGSWNIFKGNGGHQFYRDYVNLLRKCDIWCIQEALCSEHSLIDLVPEGFWGVHGGSYSRRDGLREGVLTLSKCSYIDNMNQRLLFPHPEPVLGTLKTALLGHYLINGIDTQVINLHSPLIRRASRVKKDFSVILEAISSFDGPGIMIGDFNTFSRKHFSVLESSLFDAGYQHIPIPEDDRRNWKKLDHIFCRGFEILDAQVLKGIDSSDHPPLMAQLRLK